MSVRRALGTSSTRQRDDFNTVRVSIANEIKTNKADVVGLQEAALWRSRSRPMAVAPRWDRRCRHADLDELHRDAAGSLNTKAKTKKGAGSGREPQAKVSKPCYRGYRLSPSSRSRISSQLRRTDHNPGPDGKTFDISQSASSDDFANGWGATTIQSPRKALPWDQRGPAAGGGVLGRQGQRRRRFDRLRADPRRQRDQRAVVADGTSVSGLQAGPSPWGCDSPSTTTRPPTPRRGRERAPPRRQFRPRILAGNSGKPDDGTPPCTAAEITGVGGHSVCPTGVSYDSVGNGLDASGITDCHDNSGDPGPAQGAGGWPFTGFDGDQDPLTPGSQENVCVFHGIDMDGRLTMRDAIIALKVGKRREDVERDQRRFNSGAAVLVLVQAWPSKVQRGFNAVDAKVRGHKFHFVNTHLEAFDGVAQVPTRPTTSARWAAGQWSGQTQAKQLLAGPLCVNPAGRAGR